MITCRDKLVQVGPSPEGDPGRAAKVSRRIVDARATTRHGSFTMRTVRVPYGIVVERIDACSDSCPMRAKTIPGSRMRAGIERSEIEPSNPSPSDVQDFEDRCSSPRQRELEMSRATARVGDGGEEIEPGRGRVHDRCRKVHSEQPPD